jgi:hypothetical protein
MALLDGTNAPTITVEFDYGWRGIFTIGISPLGSSDVLGGTSGTNWQAIDSNDIRNISIRRGRTREDQANQPGQLTLVVDNRSGNYDPDNASSPYQWYGYSTLMRGMGIRVSATYSSTTQILYTGYVEQIATDASLDPIVTFTATDGLAIIAAQNLATIASSYSGDTTATRIGRILDAIGWSPRSLTGSRQMQPTTWGNTALAACEEATACEFGRFHVSRSGVATLIPYENLKTSTLQFNLSDTRSAGTVEYDTIVTTPGARYLINNVILTQYSGRTQTSTNTSSSNRFGLYTKNVTAPLLSDSDASTMAGYYASRWAFPLTRVDRVEFDAVGLTTQWSGILASELGDRVTVARTTVDSRSLSYTNLIESINHDITPNSWRIGLDLSPSTF